MRIGVFRAVAGALLSVALLAGTAGLVPAQDAEGGGGTPAGDAKQYPEGVDGLKQLWADILAKATAGEEDAVRGILEKMVMSEADFTALFGEERGKDVAAKYAEKYAKLWPGEAKNITAKVKEKKYEEIDVAEVTASKDATGGDRRVLSALKEGTKMYSVRLKRKGEKAGLRYDSLFFVNGAWKCGTNRLAKLLGGGDEKGEGKGEKPPAAPGGGTPPPGGGADGGK